MINDYQSKNEDLVPESKDFRIFNLYCLTVDSRCVDDKGNNIPPRFPLDSDFDLLYKLSENKLECLENGYFLDLSDEFKWDIKKQIKMSSKDLYNTLTGYDTVLRKYVLECVIESFKIKNYLTKKKIKEFCQNDECNIYKTDIDDIYDNIKKYITKYKDKI